MKKHLLVLAALAAASGAVHAQNVYGGLGLPGLVTLGYSEQMGSGWNIRGEYAGGLSIDKDGVQDGVTATGSLKAERAGVYADWYPFNGGFRMVGGVSFNDIKLNLNATSSPLTISTINGKTVNMAGQVFNVNVNFPSVTPYIGIGYGHHFSTVKGLGFYADLGVLIGTFNTEVATSLLDPTSGPKDINGNLLVTKADIDAQTQTMRDSIGSYSVLPSFSLGLTYEF